MSGFSVDWLTLREPYDLRARSREVIAAVAASVAALPSVNVVDLACGTGATVRALTAHLPSRQVWRLADNDLGLLGRANAITLADHVDAISDAATAAGSPVVLAVHSGSGFSGYAASDRVPDRIAAMVYVDSGPGVGAMNPGFEGAELPLNWEEL